MLRIFFIFLQISDAWKDDEFFIIGNDVNIDWLGLLFDVYRAYVEDLNVFCWSSGMALPTLSDDAKSTLGAVARISSRSEQLS